MKQEEARRLVLAKWDRWVKEKGEEQSNWN